MIKYSNLMNTIKHLKRIENDSFKNLVIVDNNLLYATLNDAVQLIHVTKNQKTELLEVIKLKPNAKSRVIYYSLECFSCCVLSKLETGS